MTTRIDKVAVLGTGVLGSQIAYQTAYSGFDVTAHDISDEILEKARNGFAGLAARYEQEVEGASDGSARAALAKIVYSSRLERELYTKLAQLAPKKAIFVTNSSTLLPSDLADATGRPDRFLALHFANEIWIHNTAEIMGHAHTHPDVYEAVVDFARRIGMVPIELRKEQPGYVVNSLQVPFLQAAQALVVKGVADPETVDKAWRTATGAPHGPFQALDVIGLTTVYNIDAAGDEESQANARYLKEHYIDQGKLGRATGEGFYRYDTVAARS